MSTRLLPSAEPRFSRSLEYGVAILESFSAEHPALRNSEIASLIGVSRATANRYLKTLVDLGHLKQDGNRRYVLAGHAASAGMAVINTVRLESRARAILEDLREQTGHTASIGLLDRARVLYVYRLHGHRTGQYEADGSLRAGAYVPAHSTIIGKALLASLIESEFRSLLQTMCPSIERDTATWLADEIERVRLKGIAFGDEHTPRARSVAAPVMRRLDKPILAVQITVPTGSCPSDDLLARFGGPVRHAAKLLSA